MRRMGMGMLTAAMAISFSLVSVVAEAATVPNVVRQPFAAARTALGRAGLRARGAGTVNTNIRSLIGKVASQAIRSGTSVPRRTIVKLRVYHFQAISPLQAKINAARRAMILSRRRGLTLCRQLKNAGARTGFARSFGVGGSAN